MSRLGAVAGECRKPLEVVGLTHGAQCVAILHDFCRPRHELEIVAGDSCHGDSKFSEKFHIP